MAPSSLNGDFFKRIAVEKHHFRDWNNDNIINGGNGEWWSTMATGCTIVNNGYRSIVENYIHWRCFLSQLSPLSYFCLYLYYKVNFNYWAVSIQETIRVLEYQISLTLLSVPAKNKCYAYSVQITERLFCFSWFLNY